MSGSRSLVDVLNAEDAYSCVLYITVSSELSVCWELLDRHDSSVPPVLMILSVDILKHRSVGEFAYSSVIVGPSEVVILVVDR